MVNRNCSPAAMLKFSIALAVLSSSSLSPVMAAPSSSNSRPSISQTTSTYARASFVPPAAPSVVSPQRSSKENIAYPPSFQKQIATEHGAYPAYNYQGMATMPPATALFAKKKGGGGAATAKKGKVQVQLLQTVPKIGQKGDIVFVSSAVFQNQLKRDNLASLISDEEVEKIEQKKEEKEEELTELALKTKSMLEDAMLENLGGEQQCEDDAKDICGVALEMRKKAGPTGNLFGGVSAKMIMDALKEKYPKGAWDGKQVKVTGMKDAEGNDVPKMDIKNLGDYSVSVALGHGVDVLFILSILEE